MELCNSAKSSPQIFIERFLSLEELNGFSQSISNAYSAVQELYRSTPALGAFMVGGDLRPHLLRVYVEHSLQKYADTNTGFSHEIRPNFAKNCHHFRLYKNGLALTSHYMGSNCERPGGRKTLYKTNLSERNMNLFSFEDEGADNFKNIGYAQIMHGGFFRPSSILINIPSRDQTYSVGSFLLSVVGENKTQVEEILEEIPFKAHQTIEQLKNDNTQTG